MAAANGNGGTRAAGPRCIALVGPFQSGKTTLLEAILARTGAIQRQGTVEAGTTVGDASKEARHHKMSVELTVATTTFMGDSYTFIDCPGSVEFIHDMRAALPAVDAAVVVCEADEKKVPQLQLILRELEDLNIPRFLFLNKIDKAETKVMEALQTAAAGLAQAAGAAPDSDLEERHRHRLRRSRARARPCLQGARAVRGRAARGREPRPQQGCALLHAGEARRPRRRADGAVARGHSAAARQGVRRSRQGAARGPGGAGADGRRHPHQRRAAAAQGAAPRGARTWRRPPSASASRAASRSPMCSRRSTPPMPARCRSCACCPARSATASRCCRPSARPAACPAPSSCSARPPRSAARRPPARPSRSASSNTPRPATRCRPASRRMRRWSRCEPHPAVLAISVSAKERKDDVKLGQALHKLVDEDPSIHLVHNPETHEVVMWGQGEMHLRVAAERLADRFGVAISTGRPTVGYNETIKKAIQQRGRHKKQSGGHGQFGDVVLDIKPLPRSVGLQVRGQDHRRRGAAQLHPVGRGGRDQRAQARPARLPGGGRVGGAGRRLLSHRQFLRHGVPDRGAHRHRRRPAAVPAGAARADPPGRDRLPDRRDRQDERDPVRPARPDSRLRHPRGLGRLGRGARQDAGIGDRRSHHRGALGDRRRRLLHLQVRPHGRTDRQDRRPDRRGAAGAAE